MRNRLLAIGFKLLAALTKQTTQTFSVKLPEAGSKKPEAKTIEIQ